MPGIVDLPGSSGNPYFVSVSAMLRQDGKIDLSPLSEGARFLVERHLERELPGGCLVYAPGLHEGNRPDRASLGVAAVQSSAILAGTVTGWIQGFQHGIPGTLVRVEIGQVAKGVPLEEEVLLFFPIGDFEFGPLQVCNRSERFSRLPELDDEVLLFLNQERPSGVVNVGGSDIVVFPKGEARGIFPPRFAESDDKEKSADGLSLALVLERVRREKSLSEGGP
jgi:hypothetical protein